MSCVAVDERSNVKSEEEIILSFHAVIVGHGTAVSQPKRIDALAVAFDTPVSDFYTDFSFGFRYQF